MKKVLVVTMIMVLASLASAALVGSQISVNGQLGVEAIEIVPCTTLVLGIHVGADMEGLGYLVIQSETGGEWYDGITDVEAGFVNDPAGELYPLVYAGAGNYPGSTIRYTEEGWGFGYEITVAGGVPAVLPGGLAFEFLFHCTEPGVVVITLWEDPDYDTAAATLTITQVPEPTTIALLGLGGLLLRKRS